MFHYEMQNIYMNSYRQTWHCICKA